MLAPTQIFAIFPKICMTLFVNSPINVCSMWCHRRTFFSLHKSRTHPGKFTFLSSFPVQVWKHNSAHMMSGRIHFPRCDKRIYFKSERVFFFENMNLHFHVSDLWIYDGTNGLDRHSQIHINITRINGIHRQGVAKTVNLIFWRTKPEEKARKWQGPNDQTLS